MLRVIGPSYCVPEGFEVMFEHRRYNIFEIDLMARSTLIYEPIRAKRRAMAVSARGIIMASCYRCGAPTQTHNIELSICAARSDALVTAEPKTPPTDVQSGLPDN